MEDNFISYDETVLENLLTFQIINNENQEEIILQNENIIENQLLINQTLENGLSVIYIIFFVYLGYKVSVDFIKGVLG